MDSRDLCGKEAASLISILHPPASGVQVQHKLTWPDVRGPTSALPGEQECSLHDMLPCGLVCDGYTCHVGYQTLDGNRSRLRSRVLELDRLPLQQGGAHQYGRDYDVLTVSICWHTHLPSPPRTISLPCTSINKSAWCSGNFLFSSGNKYLAWIELYCRSPRICKLKILCAQVKNINSVFWQAHRASWNFGCLIPTYTLCTVRYHDLPGS